jgi:hypothetical protein
MTPTADKTKFLTLHTGTRTRGKAILKVADVSAPYHADLTAVDCSQCQITEIGVDSNVAGNPVAPGENIVAHPRIELAIWGGSDVLINGFYVRNSTAVQSVSVHGNGITVSDSVFEMMGDDRNHVIHDTSTVYLLWLTVNNHAEQIHIGIPRRTGSSYRHRVSRH